MRGPLIHQERWIEVIVPDSFTSIACQADSICYPRLASVSEVCVLTCSTRNMLPDCKQSSIILVLLNDLA